jgi:hypothetical protein
MGNKWLRACDLTEVYYDAGARLRSWYRKGICEKKSVGRFEYYHLIKSEGVKATAQATLFGSPKPRPY